MKLQGGSSVTQVSKANYEEQRACLLAPFPSPVNISLQQNIQRLSLEYRVIILRAKLIIIIIGLYIRRQK